MKLLALVAGLYALSRMSACMHGLSAAAASAARQLLRARALLTSLRRPLPHHRPAPPLPCAYAQHNMYARAQGSMEGEYTMWLLDEKSGEWKDTMEVQIGRFKLDMNGKQVQSLS